ncbi:MAG: class I SAM-dependent methyltransferase [Erysipelotrichaceae bacterium]
MIDTIKDIYNSKIDKLIISNPKNKSLKYHKIIIHMVKVRNQYLIQFEKYTARQVFHENMNKDDAIDKTITLMSDYKQLDAYLSDRYITVKVSKKDKVFINTKRLEPKKIKPVSHNRQKNYLIPEGEAIAPLCDLGIFTKDGKIVNSMYDKYKQINRFIEMIDDVITDDIAHLNIIDFGCGKSYLTFILYYYLVYIRKIEAHMVGLDLKKEVIANCNEIAKKYGYDNLKFEVGDINGYKCDFDVDMVISLHACDTATDYALYNAISWNAKMIFSVPCCQHEANQTMDNDSLKLLSKYGLLKERFASILTDEIRANLLEYSSYNVSVLEFIDMTHSPKNILIRAIRNDKMSLDRRNKALEEVEEVLDIFKISSTLYKLLKK